MEWAIVWRLVEAVSNAFYEPLIFWSVPFGVALMSETVRRCAGHCQAVVSRKAPDRR